jgi:hypothetical protein
MNHVGKYFGVTMLYCFVRSTLQSYNREKTYFNYETSTNETKPMLRAEKMGIVLHQAVAAPIVWPYMMGEDAVYLELYICNKTPETYGRSPLTNNY